MSRMGKARKIFNKNPGFPPYLFDITRFSGTGSVQGRYKTRETDPQPVRIRLPFFKQYSFPADGLCRSG